MKLSRPLTALTLVLVIGATACGGGTGGTSSTAGAPNPNAPEVNPAGDIPDNQAYVAYAPPGGGYAVKVPEGWSRSTAGGAATFTDKLNAITMEARPAPAAMTVRQAERAEVPQLAHSVKGFKLGGIAVVRRRPGRVVRITYTAAGRPNPVTGKTVTDAVERYVFFHRGRDLVLTLSGPRGADNVDPWRIVTDSVTWSA